MSSPQPFAPGSPASAPSTVLGRPMTLPPLNFQSSSSADGRAVSSFDNSGFSVNYGGALSASVLPSWLWLVVAAGGAWWLLRKR